MHKPAQIVKPATVLCEEIGMTTGLSGRATTAKTFTTTPIMALIDNLKAEGRRQPARGPLYRERNLALLMSHFDFDADGHAIEAQLPPSQLSERLKALSAEWEALAIAATECSDALKAALIATWPLASSTKEGGPL